MSLMPFEATDASELLGARIRTARKARQWTQAELGERRSEISRLRGDNQSLRVDVRTLVERVDDLSGQIRVMESVVDVERVGAEVLSLPRRPMKHQRMLWSDDDVWNDDDLPSVVDLVRSDVVAQATSDVRRQA